MFNIEYLKLIFSEIMEFIVNNHITISGVLLFGFLLWYFGKMLYENRQLPPGPWGLPWVGYLPWISSPSPHRSYVDLSYKYGDIYSVRLGSQLIVCISSAHLLRDLFNRAESTGRPKTPLNDLLKGYGIVTSEDALWKSQRHFLATRLRMLGVSLAGYSDRFERMILTEVHEFLSNISECKDKPLSPAKQLGRHMHNIICNVMMSYRFEAADEQYEEFNRRVHYGMRLYGQLNVSEYIPMYLHLPGKRKIVDEIARNVSDMCQFHKKLIEKRRREREVSKPESPADLLDCYLEEMEKPEDIRAKTFAGVNEEKQILQVMNDLFSAGMETSRSALVWTIAMVVREPNVAARVRKELGTVVERGEPVLLHHRPKLIYTEAVVLETLRRCFIVPLGTSHINIKEWTVRGYKIPKYSQIIPLINKIHMDPKAFNEPELFKPERFIDSDGKLCLTNPYFIPYGVGRRICLGDSLARIELFLFFANIMNNTEFYLPEGDPLPGLEGEMGSNHIPTPFEIIFSLSPSFEKNSFLKRCQNKNVTNGI